MRKIPRTAKLDEAVKLDKHVVVLPINYIVHYLRVKNNADFVENELSKLIGNLDSRVFTNNTMVT